MNYWLIIIIKQKINNSTWSRAWSKKNNTRLFLTISYFIYLLLQFGSLISKIFAANHRRTTLPIIVTWVFASFGWVCNYHVILFYLLLNSLLNRLHMLTQVLRAFSLVSGIRKISQRSRLQTENIDPDECQLLRHAIQSVDREHDLCQRPLHQCSIPELDSQSCCVRFVLFWTSLFHQNQIQSILISQLHYSTVNFRWYWFTSVSLRGLSYGGHHFWQHGCILSPWFWLQHPLGRSLPRAVSWWSFTYPRPCFGCSTDGPIRAHSTYQYYTSNTVHCVCFLLLFIRND
jgi:hypothetical protein